MNTINLSDQVKPQFSENASKPQDQKNKEENTSDFFSAIHKKVDRVPKGQTDTGLLKTVLSSPPENISPYERSFFLKKNC